MDTNYTADTATYLEDAVRYRQIASEKRAEAEEFFALARDEAGEDKTLYLLDMKGYKETAEKFERSARYYQKRADIAEKRAQETPKERHSRLEGEETAVLQYYTESETDLFSEEYKQDINSYAEFAARLNAEEA